MHAVIILLLLLGLLLGPQAWVQYVMRRYNRKAETNFPGTGGELARHLLDRFGLTEVRVQTTEAGDHYDPETRAVRLTTDKYEGRTLTAITVAAHEVGHALQHAAGESLFMWRSRLAVLAFWAERIGSFLLFAAPLAILFTRAPSPGVITALAAFLVMGFGVVVQLITLPVEIDASFNKALPILDKYLDDSQKRPARRILRAAAWTYVAASMSGLLNFWRWLAVLRR